MYCIGCGEPLRVTSGPCSICRTAATGADLTEAVRLEYGKGVVIPPVCCCCLAPREDTRDEEIATITLAGEKRSTKVPMPWCSGCRSRRRTYERMATLGWILSGAALYFLFAPLVDDYAYAIGFFGGIGGYIATPALLFRFFPNMRLPGHVPRCDAVHGSAGEKNAQLVLRNRAFAQIWRDLNSGRGSAAPALAWAETSRVAPDGFVPRATPRNTVVETDARVREQLQTARVPPRSRLKLQQAPVGADATAEILRFAVKAMEIGPERLLASSRNGATREILLSHVTGVAARRMPDEAPFLGTIFLDIIAASPEPVRVLPTTRANYASLPGSGATSHENFRRLVRFLKDRAPALVVEPESAPYLEEGIGLPPRIETTEALVAFDRRYS
jgi:hypothetical protein